LKDLGVCERYNIKTDVEGIEWDGVDRTDLAQGRDRWLSSVNTVMNLRVP
jgi:hypothetical protein